MSRHAGAVGHTLDVDHDVDNPIEWFGYCECGWTLGPCATRRYIEDAHERHNASNPGGGS